MSSGERPIGAAKGKQSDTEALCQTPPHYSSVRLPCTVCFPLRRESSESQNLNTSSEAYSAAAATPTICTQIVLLTFAERSNTLLSSGGLEHERLWVNIFETRPHTFPST